MIRWTKVFRDLWNNRSRTILVILSIAVGIFAIGMISTTQSALAESLSAQYAALRPADIVINTEPGLDEDFIKSLRHLDGVREVEGRRSLPLRISLDGSGDTWRDITLYAIDDYTNQRIFLVNQQDGNWPPEKKQVLLERASMEYMGVKPGDALLVKNPGGKTFRLEVEGRAHDLYRIPPLIEGWLFGYIDSHTLRWMGEPEGFNEVYIESESKDTAAIQNLSDRVADRIEGLGLPVYQKTLPRTGEHPLQFIIDTVVMLLGLLAALSLGLSALLVINVISALIVQQERQIGIMKAIGAKSWQIFSLYAGMVLILGLMACLIAIPFSNLGANALAGFVAGLINFDPPRVDYTLASVLLQAGVGLIVPLLAAAPSILSGTRVSPAMVLSEYGINQVWGGAGIIDSLLKRFTRISRATLLAVRNPFRKRSRLILSLITLTFAGGVFMAIVNLQTSLNGSLNEMFRFWKYDAWLVIDEYVPARKLINEARSVPGVKNAEAWGFTIGRIVREDGSESDNLYLLAPPAGTELLDPPIISGRKLKPGDKNALLVSPGLLANEPDIQLGSRVDIKIEGQEQPYTIVGVMNMMGNSTIGYFSLIDYEAYTRHVREPNRANAIILTLDARDMESQQRILSQVEQRYDRANIKVVSSFLISEERVEINGAFSVLVALLMVMTLVLATVGGLGLMGTMSLNVIERTREIGVMRAYGAPSRAVFRIVVIEGLLIGLLSWLLSIIISLPLSNLLAHTIGLSFMDHPLTPSYSLVAIGVWLLMVILISIIASLFPALRAVRLTVTEVLAYE